MSRHGRRHTLVNICAVFLLLVFVTPETAYTVSGAHSSVAHAAAASVASAKHAAAAKGVSHPVAAPAGKLQLRPSPKHGIQQSSSAAAHGGELQAPVPGAPLSNDVVGAKVINQVHSTLNTVIKMLNTHESAHDKRKASLAAQKKLQKKLIKTLPTCGAPPGNLRFCTGVAHEVYRDNGDTQFDVLDYDAHKTFNLYVQHMDLTAKDVPLMPKCKASFKSFLCARDFPHCCDVRVCGAYGGPESTHDKQSALPSPYSAGSILATPAPSAAPSHKTSGGANGAGGRIVHTGATKSNQVDVGRAVKHSGKSAKVVIFDKNGTMQVDSDLPQKTDNATVLVKTHDRPCLYYNVTYAPLFDCQLTCQRMLTFECQHMLHATCDQLCLHMDNPQCATRHLLRVAHTDDIVNHGGHELKSQYSNASSIRSRGFTHMMLLLGIGLAIVMAIASEMLTS